MLKKILVLFLILILVVGMYGCGSKKSVDANNEVSASSDNSKADGTEDSNSISIEKVVFNQDGFKVTALSLEKDEDEPAIKLKLENSSDKDATFILQDASINGFMATYEYDSSIVDIKSGNNTEDVIAFYQVNLDEYGISEIATIEFQLYIIDSDGNLITDAEYITINTGIESNYSFDTSGETVFDKDGIKIVAQHYADSEKTIKFYIENNTNKKIRFVDNDGITINGTMTDAGLFAVLAPGKKEVVDMYFYDLEDTINEVEFSLDIMDEDSLHTIYTEEIALTYK